MCINMGASDLFMSCGSNEKCTLYSPGKFLFGDVNGPPIVCGWPNIFMCFGLSAVCVGGRRGWLLTWRDLLSYVLLFVFVQASCRLRSSSVGIAYKTKLGHSHM